MTTTGSRTKFSAVLLLAIAIVSGTRQTAREFPHDAYIWQRRWTPAVSAAVKENADLVYTWRVLIAELNARGEWASSVIDADALRESGRPVVLVIRIDGSRIDLQDAQTISTISAMIDHWRHSSLDLRGVEIDHDSSVAGLINYRRFLAKLHATLPPGIPLAITALPAWLSSPDVDQLFAQVDEVVLQVHAVRNPHAGLFDPVPARRWINGCARHTRKPFRVALPAYGSRVNFDSGGRLIAVQAEMPSLAGGESATELIASPHDVAALLRGLERCAPANLAGVAWFRLPIDSDQRAWSAATWRAVIHGEMLLPRVEARLQATAVPGMSNLVLANAGHIDAELPRSIELPDSCAIGDGVNGYVLGSTATHLNFLRLQPGLLRSGYQQTIGWIRCAPSPEMIHVQP